jgi:tripartite ATP-independent transporter DctM subunit
LTPHVPRQSTITLVEDAAASAVLLAMVGLPIVEIAGRRLFGVGIPASGPIVQHLTLWVGFLGAAIAARDGKLLTLATGAFIPDGRPRRIAHIAASALAAWASLVLAWGGGQLVSAERAAETTIGAGIPTWVAQSVLPGAFALIALRLVWRAGPSHIDRLAASSGLVAAAIVMRAPEIVEGSAAWPGLVAIAGVAVLGMPLFAILGGAAAWLFLHDGITPAAILVETYSLSVSPTLPAIPLFTLAGFLLAEGRASTRLLRVFRALVGWAPGGTAVVCAVLCSFFTVFTGGSGVTILALGGVLFPALLADGYRERFALGLLTASGSLGLLLPPALPLILYAVVAQIPIEDIFLGGVLPGVVLTALVAAWGVREGIVTGGRRQPFEPREAGAAIWAAKWELAMPLLVLAVMFSGLATAVETAALTAAYAWLVQAVIHRDLGSGTRPGLLPVVTECVTVVGGVLIILGVAVGFTSYLVNAQVPAALVEWTLANVRSRAMFLLLLNVFLLLVGCLMDIFAAIVVVVPLIVPLGTAFGIHPVHLGIILIANLELGFLTPPVGLNLFLASYRFKRPILEVCRAALPMMAILAAGVLIITYVPWLTTGLLDLFGEL